MPIVALVVIVIDVVVDVVVLWCRNMQASCHCQNNLIYKFFGFHHLDEIQN